MDWDLGFAAVGLLLAMSLGFGLLAQLLAGRGTTRWMWLIGAGTFFVGFRGDLRRPPTRRADRASTAV